MILATRPPLDDDRKFEKRVIASSTARIENRVHDSLRHCFTDLTRSSAALSDEIVRRLGAAARFAKVDFHVKDGAQLKRISDDSPDQNELGATLVYLVSTPLNGGGKVVAAFGMGGVETMLWSQVLARRGALIREFMNQADGIRLRIEQLTVPQLIKYPWYEHSDHDLQCKLVADVCF